MKKLISASKLLLHIGYHKTGTTWLQDEVFDNHEYGFVSPWHRKHLIEDFVIPSPLSFNADAARTKYNVMFEQAQDENAVPVLTHERLSGYPSSGGFDSKTIADRLFQTFPDSYILIVIREQKSMIRSLYTQYIRDGGGLPIRRYLNPPEPDLFRVPLFKYDFYKYHRLISYYQKHFSAERVIVLPFEMLIEDPVYFMKKMTEFLSLPPIEKLQVDKKNVGIGVPWTAINRTCNRFFSVNQLNPGGLVNAPGITRNVRRFARLVNHYFIPRIAHDHLERKIRDYIANEVGSRFVESNRRTGDLIGMDLERYGYD